MHWDYIESVSIITSDEGLLLPDVCWCLEGKSSEVILPQMALGEKEVMDRLTAFEQFDFGELGKAMKSTENARFLVWTRK